MTSSLRIDLYRFRRLPTSLLRIQLDPCRPTDRAVRYMLIGIDYLVESATRGLPMMNGIRLQHVINQQE